MSAFTVVAIVSSTIVFFVVLELIRRDRLKERYSLIWISAASVMVIFSIWRPLLHFIARIFGIDYPPSFLFLLLIGFLIILLLHFSTVISSLSEKNSRLAQEIGILKSQMKNLESIGIPHDPYGS